MNFFFFHDMQELGAELLHSQHRGPVLQHCSPKYYNASGFLITCLIKMLFLKHKV